MAHLTAMHSRPNEINELSINWSQSELNYLINRMQRNQKKPHYLYCLFELPLRHIK